MADFRLRDVDDRALDLLKQQAEAYGRSLNSELKRIVEQAARDCDVDAARASADRIRAEMAGRAHPDSALLVREERDRRAVAARVDPRGRPEQGCRTF